MINFYGKPTYLPASGEFRTLGLCFRWCLVEQLGLWSINKNVRTYYHNWDTHKLQQSATLLIMFPSYFDCPSREPVYVFRCAYKVG